MSRKKPTQEEIDAYVAFVTEQGRQRQEKHGLKDAVAFAMGASCWFFLHEVQDQVPAIWIFGASTAGGPFPPAEVGEAKEAQPS